MSGAGGTDFAKLRNDVVVELDPAAGLTFDDVVFGFWGPGEWDGQLSQTQGGSNRIAAALGAGLTRPKE